MLALTAGAPDAMAIRPSPDLACIDRSLQTALSLIVLAEAAGVALFLFVRRVRFWGAFTAMAVANLGSFLLFQPLLVVATDVYHRLTLTRGVVIAEISIILVEGAVMLGVAWLPWLRRPGWRPLSLWVVLAASIVSNGLSMAAGVAAHRAVFFFTPPRSFMSQTVVVPPERLAWAEEWPSSMPAEVLARDGVVLEWGGPR